MSNSEARVLGKRKSPEKSDASDLSTSTAPSTPSTLGHAPSSSSSSSSPAPDTGNSPGTVAVKHAPPPVSFVCDSFIEWARRGARATAYEYGSAQADVFLENAEAKIFITNGIAQLMYMKSLQSLTPMSDVETYVANDLAGGKRAVRVAVHIAERARHTYLKSVQEFADSKISEHKDAVLIRCLPRHVQSAISHSYAEQLRSIVPSVVTASLSQQLQSLWMASAAPALRGLIERGQRGQQ